MLRTLIEAGIGLDLETALERAAAQQPAAGGHDTLEALWLFHMERLRGYYVDHGFAADCFDAVAALDITDIHDFDRRVRAVSVFSKLPVAALVCAAHKRIRNIVNKTGYALGPNVFQSARLEQNAEKNLADIWHNNRSAIDDATRAGEYERALTTLTQLAEPLDHFFDDVMVMTDDPSLRQNRLALLGEIDRLCRRVADISRLVTT